MPAGRWVRGACAPGGRRAAVLLLAAALPAGGASQESGGPAGAEVYERWCASCHGVEGRGDGPAAAYMLPRPRDFTRGLYQIRTTRGGEIPTDADILHVIDQGMPGTTMPGWERLLSRADRDALVGYIKAFYPPFATLPAPVLAPVERAPGASDDRLAEGRIFYDSIECWQCHGQGGRGDGTSAPTLEDEWGNPVRAADLTQAYRFTGGGTVEDIYRRLLTGMDGTPMPAFADLLDAGFMTGDQLWSLAHYVRSLSPTADPSPREVIRAERVEPGQVPTSLSDPRWDEADGFHIPLVGQVIALPRWFDPAVTAVEVAALHDGEELALRVRWNDRSRSPDAAWAPWQARILETMAPREGDPVEPGPRPDRLVVQFPPTIPTGMDRPWFLMGDVRAPVYQWGWTSADTAPSRFIARGIRDQQPLPAGGLTGEANWEEGRWQLLLRRPLQTGEEAGVLQFEPGVSIPVAFFAWDGDNGEEGTRGAVSSWYYIHLEQPVPLATWLAPGVAFLLTFGLGLFVVARARKGASVPSSSGMGEVSPATT